MKLVVFSLIISFLGIFILLLISFYLQPTTIKSYQELRIGDYVQVTGKIILAKDSSFKLDKNITILCENKFKTNDTVQVKGKVIEFQGRLFIDADKVIQ